MFDESINSGYEYKEEEDSIRKQWEYIKRVGYSKTFDEYKKYIEDTRRLKQEYYDNHSHCPKCGNISLSTTYIGYMFSLEKADQYKDENNRTCSCGWSGTTHELVAK